MSKRAEEAALTLYPVTMVRRRYDGIVSSEDPYDSNLHDRYCCQKGYEQAEKDLTLTWRDIMQICDLFLEINYNQKYDTVQDKYEKILEAFNEWRGKK